MGARFCYVLIPVVLRVRSYFKFGSFGSFGPDQKEKKMFCPGSLGVQTGIITEILKISNLTA